MNKAELRRLKEHFVSNLPGTTKWEVFCLIGCLPLCLLIGDHASCVCIASLAVVVVARNKRLLPAASSAEQWVQARLKALQLRSFIIRAACFLVDFAIVVLVQVAISMSVAPPEPSFLLLFLLWGSLALKLWVKLSGSPAAKQHIHQICQQLVEPRKR